MAILPLRVVRPQTADNPACKSNLCPGAGTLVLVEGFSEEGFDFCLYPIRAPRHC